MLDGVAVVEHRNRQLDHAGIGLHSLSRRTATSTGTGRLSRVGIMQRDGLMPDRPLARGEVATATSSAVNESRTAIPRFILSSAQPLLGFVPCSGLCGPLHMIYVTAT